MTEAEWLACSYPACMLEGKRGWRRSTRKLRLLACECLRRVWHLLSDAGRNAVLVAESHADGDSSNESLAVAQPAFVRGGNTADNGAHFAAAPSRLFRSWAGQAMNFAAWSVEEEGPNHEAEQRDQCQLIRDIFGNPFRSVAVDPTWRTEAAIGLAQGIYDDRAFERLPILADALEEAGCDNQDILTHCREPGLHARGCWAIDLVLGRE